MAESELTKSVELLSSISTHSKHVLDTVSALCEQVKSGEMNTRKGLSLLDVKCLTMLEYLTDLTYLNLRKVRGMQIGGDTTVARIAENRVVLEKLRPLEHKLKYQIDKLIKTAKTGSVPADDPLKFRPHPTNMMSKVDPPSDDGEEGEVDDEVIKRVDSGGVYKPPKLVAMHYGEDSRSSRDEKAAVAARKRALSSSVMQELRREYSDAPEEVWNSTDTSISYRREMQKKKEYEEAHFTRVRESKEDRVKKRKSMTTMGSLGDELTSFGDLRGLDDNFQPNAPKKKHLSQKKKRGAKKGFKKKRKFR